MLVYDAPYIAYFEELQSFYLFLVRINDASVIVAKYHDGFVPQIGMKYPFARAVEVVAVGKSEEFHGYRCSFLMV